MAMSYPALVIASDLPPNRDIVKDNVNGLLFKAGSSPDLARRMQEVLEGGADTSAMRHTAREDVEKRFGYRKVGQDYYNLLTGLG